MKTADVLVFSIVIAATQKASQGTVANLKIQAVSLIITAAEPVHMCAIANREVWVFLFSV